jgi:uncharacterized OsmC-like protein
VSVPGGIMNREQFKAIQAPFKTRYRNDPSTALLTLRAVGHASADLAFTVETPRGPLEAGLHPAAGGEGTLSCAEDMLLETLVACSGVTLRAVATSFGIEVRDARIVAEGDIDMRGTLAIAKDVPVGFRAIRLRFELDSDAPDEKLDKLIEATEHYCIVLQTLRQPTEVRSTRVRLAPAGAE